VGQTRALFGLARVYEALGGWPNGPFAVSNRAERETSE
jgi:hypothetical protein